MIEELKCLIGVALAALLGFLIGLERKFRSKEAGVRTHTIVSFGAALIMVVSKYGFSDIASYDASRVAAQIVSGIGFLGAGIIVYRQNSIKGLTTAAGVWATAGVGMAAGAKLYLVATVAAAVLIGLQLLLHADWRIFKYKRAYKLCVRFIQQADEGDKIKEIFKVEHFSSLKMDRDEKEGIVCEATISTEQEFSSKHLSQIMEQNTFISSVHRIDDE